VGIKSPVHPNDHVNMGQSSKILFHAIHVAAAVAVNSMLLPALRQLQKNFGKKAQAFNAIVRQGARICKMPLHHLGQEFSGYENQVKKSIERVERALPSIYELAVVERRWNGN